MILYHCWNIAVNNTICVTSLVMCLVFDVVLLSERIRHLASAKFSTYHTIPSCTIQRFLILECSGSTSLNLLTLMMLNSSKNPCMDDLVGTIW